jgi:DNA-binding transcriptional MerR regulator
MNKTNDPELLKIGDFAKFAETNLRTLRYYEELGLLHPAARSPGGFRFYRRTDSNRLAMIRDLQSLGLQLDRIRELMATREAVEDRKSFFSRVRAALREQDRLLAERMESIELQRSHIRVAMTKVSACETCEHMPGVANNFCEPCNLTGAPLPGTVSALY